MKTDQSPSDGKGDKSQSQGFTLTDLLAVVAVVAVLICFQLAAWGGTRGRTRITQCAAHLRQFDLALQIYGNENHDILPAVPGPFGAAGQWAWDLDTRIINAIEPYGAVREVLYCPAHPAWNCDATWNFSVSITGVGFRILGYVTALPADRELPANLANATLIPQAYQNGSVFVPAPLPSQRVLLADATISYLGSYNHITIGGLPPTINQRTSHLAGHLPAGGNVAMLDGHVEWHEFSKMQVAFGTPTFHW